MIRFFVHPSQIHHGDNDPLHCSDSTSSVFSLFIGNAFRKLSLYAALGGIRSSTFEDFATHNAFDLLAKYSPTHLVLNDDIQGTSVVLAGLISALRLVGGSLADYRFLFLGAYHRSLADH